MKEENDEVEELEEAAQMNNVELVVQTKRILLSLKRRLNNMPNVSWVREVCHSTRSRKGGQLS